MGSKFSKKGKLKGPNTERLHILSCLLYVHDWYYEVHGQKI